MGRAQKVLWSGRLDDQDYLERQENVGADVSGFLRRAFFAQAAHVSQFDRT
jgi:nitrate reductase cytochrome c-type subunit